MKSKELKQFESVLEKFWADLPIEVCFAWENYEKQTNSYEGERTN